MKTTGTLAAWGLTTDRGDAWQDRAACPDYDPEMWHAAGDSYIDWHKLGWAAHICWAHCPVRRQCYAELKGMRAAVVGGVFFNSHGNRSQHQPRATGCNKCTGAAA